MLSSEYVGLHFFSYNMHYWCAMVDISVYKEKVVSKVKWTQNKEDKSRILKEDGEVMIYTKYIM